MSHHFLLVLHLLGASVWVGGHVVLVRVVLPEALRERSPERLLKFEKAFSRIGAAAMLIQIISGALLAHQALGGWQNLFRLSVPATPFILTKLVLLACTIALALDANYRIFPRLDQSRMKTFAFHAWATTVLAILMLMVGASIRLGAFFWRER